MGRRDLFPALCSRHQASGLCEPRGCFSIQYVCGVQNGQKGKKVNTGLDAGIYKMQRTIMSASHPAHPLMAGEFQDGVRFWIVQPRGFVHIAGNGRVRAAWVLNLEV